MLPRSIVSFSLVLILGLCATVTECQGAAKMTNKKVFYQASWNSINVTGKIKINGYELTSISANNDLGSYSLNLWLVGKNELQVEASKIDPAEKAEFSVAVSTLSPGDMASTGDRGNLFNLDLTDAKLSKAKTVKISKKFNSTLDFRSHLQSSAQSPSDQELIKYAGELYGLFAGKNSGALLQEFAPKLADYAKGMYQENLNSQFESYLKDELFNAQLEKVDSNNIKAVKAGSTLALWHLLDGDKELIRTVSADGSSAELPIYIGLFEGKLKVIR